MELITESSVSKQTRLVGSAVVGADIAERLSGVTQQPQQQRLQQLQQPLQQHGVDVNDVDDVADLTDRNVVSSVARHGTSDKYSHRLISVVSDDTIQFIGAKEKLRKQLGYSGHFYRFLVYLHLCYFCSKAKASVPGASHKLYE